MHELGASLDWPLRNALDLRLPTRGMDASFQLVSAGRGINGRDNCCLALGTFRWTRCAFMSMAVIVLRLLIIYSRFKAQPGPEASRMLCGQYTAALHIPVLNGFRNRSARQQSFPGIRGIYLELRIDLAPICGG